MLGLRVNWRLVAVVLLCLTFQMTLISWVSVGDIAPNLCFLFLSFFAFQINYRQIFFVAFAIGLIRDLLSQSCFGVDAASLVLGSVTLYQIASRFDRDDSWVQLWGTFAFSLCCLVIYLVLDSSVRSAWPFDIFFLLKAFLISLYTTFSMFVGFPLFRRFLKIRVPVKQYELF